MIKLIRLRHLIAPILFLCFVGCDKSDKEDISNMDVDTYIHLLRSNQYDSLDLPPFTPEDIAELLGYRNDAQIITDFPHNPISSFFQPEVKLGIYVLWTIESIRAVAIDSEYLIMRFPSLNPILGFRDVTEFSLVSDSLSQSIAAKAYYDWWEDNRNLNFDDFKIIDPLENTDYRWH